MHSTIPFSLQQRITNCLLLNASFIDNLGLMHGKMGIAIYFFHLARETGNKIYEDYAGELIDEIYDEITIQTPCDFENGLAGIGWGIEYLVQNGFIEADTDEVLESIDNQLQSSRSQFHGVRLLNGLTGLGAYSLKRLQNPNSSDEKAATLINKQMLLYLIDELAQRINGNEIAKLINNPEIFDLTWDYPVLIAFLAEVYQLDIQKLQVFMMLQQLIDPLFQAGNIPTQHSKRLQLALSLAKLQVCWNGQLLEGNIEELIQRLLARLERNTIFRELETNNAFLRNGTMGIAYIYSNLYEYNIDKQYLIETNYWHNLSLQFEETNTGCVGSSSTGGKENCAFGFLEGLAGTNICGISCLNFSILSL